MKLAVYKGFIVRGLYFSSGHYIELYCWDSIPIDSEPYKEVWLFTPDKKSICYFHPATSKDVFSMYHSFDNVIGAENKTNWISENNFELISNTENNTAIKINFTFSTPQLWDKGSFEGKTETGKSFKNTPKKIAFIENAHVLLGDNDIGKLVKPGIIFSAFGGNLISEIPLINFCTHELEP